MLISRAKVVRVVGARRGGNDGSKRECVDNLFDLAKSKDVLRMPTA